ncbi:translation initiation factor IF-2-like [Schistocerca gregaria]|uniref:translation initiation factor IF-2-like n=1 Tax=Schistocerca gregaria TaxID=7010 RepID=UPI00211DA4C0|nr:translation initiation factor IF-2-like [Schistocerca gregaria]
MCDTSKESSHEFSRKERHRIETDSHRESKSREGIPRLHKDDYFRYACEYRHWMMETKGIHTSSMTGDMARKGFKDFVRAWNKGRLSEKYYEGIEPTSMAASTRSSYEWHFRDVDEKVLGSVRTEVNIATSGGRSRKVRQSYEESEEPDFYLPESVSSSKNRQALIGPALPPKAEVLQESAEERYERLKRERKKFRKEQELLYDELAPKPAAGREAMIEKKKLEREKRREREEEERGEMLVNVFDEDDSTKRYLLSKEMAEKRKRNERIETISERHKEREMKENKLMDSLKEMARKAGYNVR